MRCPVCAVEVGKAQLICDNCGILLMDERYRQQMEAQEGMPRKRSSPVRRVSGESLPEDEATPTESPPPSLEDQLKGQLQAHLQGSSVPETQLPPPEEDLMDLPPTDMSDVPSPPPDPGEPIVTYGGPDADEPGDDAPPPAKARGGLPPIFTSFVFLALMTLFVPLVPLFFAIKSDWEKRRKVIFIMVHLFYWGLGFLLLLLIVMAVVGAAASSPSVM